MFWWFIPKLQSTWTSFNWGIFHLIHFLNTYVGLLLAIKPSSKKTCYFLLNKCHTNLDHILSFLVCSLIHLNNLIRAKLIVGLKHFSIWSTLRWMINPSWSISSFDQPFLNLICCILSIFRLNPTWFFAIIS